MENETTVTNSGAAAASGTAVPVSPPPAETVPPPAVPTQAPEDIALGLWDQFVGFVGGLLRPWAVMLRPT